MTVTNAAAKVARNTEIDTRASALDLGLDSIVLLKRQGKSSVKNIVSPSSFRGWLESSPSEGERWLRNHAQDGDLYAMEKLAEYEFDENETHGSSAEGERWLRNAVQRGHRLAMINLGTRLITGN